MTITAVHYNIDHAFAREVTGMLCIQITLNSSLERTVSATFAKEKHHSESDMLLQSLIQFFTM